MSPSVRESRARIWCLLFFYLAVFTAYFSANFVPEDGVTVDIVELKNGPEVAIDILKDILKLAITLSAGIYAGVGALVYHWTSRKRNVDWFDVVFVVLTIISGAVTFYAVLLSYNAILNFAASDAFAPSSIQLEWGLWLTYHFLIVSAVMLASAFISSLLPRVLAGSATASHPPRR